MSEKTNRGGRGAFTIIELLVAVGVTAVLVTLMVTITINVLGAWNRSSGALSTGNQARLVLDQISQDLAGAIIRNDNNVWLVATVQRNQTTATGDSGMADGQWTVGRPKPLANPSSFLGSLLINPTVDPTDPTKTTAIENINRPLSIENYRFGQAGVWLRFFSTPSDTNASIVNSTAPRAISYQVVRRRLGGASSTDIVYSLFRSEVRPVGVATTATDSTFALGYNLLMDENLNPSYNRGLATPSSAGNIRRPNVDFLLANDVIDFGIKLYGRDAAGAEVELFPVQRNALGAAIAPVPTAVPFSFAASRRLASSPVPVTGVAPVTYGMPTAADVMVRILTPEGARLIQAIENQTLNADWWDTAIKNSQVFTRRVEIRSRAL